MQRARTIEEWKRDKERQADPRRRRHLAGIPVGFREYKWDDMEDDTSVIDLGERERSAKEVCEQWAVDWTPGAQGLVLLGPAGAGKTLGSALAAMTLIDAGVWVRWTSYADLVERETGLIGLARRAERDGEWGEHEKEELALRWLKWDCDVLFLDDIGKERRSATDFAGDLLDRLLRRRANEGKTTCITSNLGVREWHTYNESMASFLFEVGAVYEYLDAIDHRKVAAGGGR